MTCFRYLSFTSFSEVDALTIPEYDVILEAIRLREVDLDYRDHMQAFLSYSVQAEKTVGKKRKPVYTTFKKFYDYESALKAARGEKAPESRFAGLSKILGKGGK